jgi:hypothetical protein
VHTKQREQANISVLLNVTKGVTKLEEREEIKNSTELVKTSRSMYLGSETNRLRNKKVLLTPERRRPTDESKKEQKESQEGQRTARIFKIGWVTELSVGKGRAASASIESNVLLVSPLSGLVNPAM